MGGFKTFFVIKTEKVFFMACPKGALSDWFRCLNNLFVIGYPHTATKSRICSP
jgi:hypothetical protein